ncbi:MAG: glutamine amidotransferase [Actinomyces sp.]|jgi:GMP synthase (glutamine-hydrolysing)|nr:glutamine amidotransferase [Actinomyces sp.]MCI1787274.1 glutamine amidotransferase [Actinomyces sp.]MCI1829668.1 glutamine amidotransferase [Actinomyces sp.]MCI1866366.1 glutamine amidotransferase [Actinomyces sp.]
MRPFLLVSTRPEDEAIEAEYRSFQRASGRSPDALEQVRSDMLGLPEIDVQAYSGIIVAGSPYGTTTPEDRKSPTQKRTEQELTRLLAEIVAAGTPCLTTGYGTEVATVLRGGVVTTKWAELPSIIEIELTPEGREDPLLADFPPSFHTYVGHHEAVEAPPEGAVVLARSMTCPVQMMRLGPTFYATQFNPELDSDAIRSRLSTYADAGYSGTDDMDSLVLLGRDGPGGHQAGVVVRHFVDMFAR